MLMWSTNLVRIVEIDSQNSPRVFSTENLCIESNGSLYPFLACLRTRLLLRTLVWERENRFADLDA